MGCQFNHRVLSSQEFLYIHPRLSYDFSRGTTLCRHRERFVFRCKFRRAHTLHCMIRVIPFTCCLHPWRSVLHDTCHPVRCQLAKRRTFLCQRCPETSSLHPRQRTTTGLRSTTKVSSAQLVHSNLRTCALGVTLSSFMWLCLQTRQLAGPTMPNLSSWRTSGAHALRALVSCFYVCLSYMLCAKHTNTHACTPFTLQRDLSFALTYSLAPLLCARGVSVVCVFVELSSLTMLDDDGDPRKCDLWLVACVNSSSSADTRSNTLVQRWSYWWLNQCVKRPLTMF